MEEFATSSVETGKYQCLEDGVEPLGHMHRDYIGSSDRGRCDLSNQRDDGPVEQLPGVSGCCTTNPSGVFRSKKRARHSDDEAESGARRQESQRVFAISFERARGSKNRQLGKQEEHTTANMLIDRQVHDGYAQQRLPLSQTGVMSSS
jgi:hypothetical protein